MDSLQIRTGLVSLRILDDEGNERGIFRFNPEDINGAKRVVALRDELEARQEEFIKRDEECKTTEERVELLNEVVDSLEQAIDECFGEGTSKLVFGEAKSLSMFSDFLTGITPYYTKASEKRLSKYRKPTAKK